MPKLTGRQLAILNYIRKCVEEKGYPPSVREIGLAVGLASSSTVHGHLERLQSKGYLRRDPTKPRAIELLQPPPVRDSAARTERAAVPETSTVLAPVVGKVTAGLPITAIEHVEDFLPIPGNLGKDGEVFVLRVQGDSMIEAGILDGDYVIVNRQPTAANGDIVVAMTEDDEATVKRFFREADHIRLQPENASMEALRYRNVTILGKVIGLFRRMD
ncbi:transcriptional repressor LexA [Alicyclobacillus cycloheptanicus]|uniref:LexA repressor n=1 Tax=Alicyclobacillus cycloheptanicus TaxID=1457 RepID=A0ABT9XGA6_9BACL|nr:transcriptional repressor LexA [Alicyclobacillus cycloheptanicus]MDQ0189324.1 repressor LexA [Alicyclobacillus cycloheptanicus]WDM01316.1 transcriptional repressor LexA [Alicyclobacillus cycloheptanicus]